jgi:hypothetical protein
MDQDKRKLYNKQYYENHREALLEKLTTKVNCQFCNRKVSSCNLTKHFTLSICERTQAKNNYIEQRKNNT